MASFSADEVREALKEVYDPEIGVNIVDLGLVYDVDLEEDDGKTGVLITMTLTSMGCPLGPVIMQEVNRALGELPELGEIGVNLVWSPPWTPDMMSEEAKDELGIW
ncbi:MAG TPA: metal-sulfur cluster assembly factor [Thermomicrobiaceae bacterium]|nr:metal-sulfur cluster assembly factor [Thermomicrobiaceae bacterium]